MKRLVIIRGGVTMALMLGILVAVASSAEASRTGQLGAYMREGLSLKRAQVALATQSQVEAAELPVRLEKALGASFAGMWFEPNTGKFCIGVVSSSSRRAAEQVVAQTGLAGVVRYVSVRSTWTELISAQGEWGLKLEHLRGQQFSTGLTPSNNAVSVTLSSSVPKHERALLEREAARSDVNVSITVVPPQALEDRPANSQCEFKPPPGERYAFCSKPIAAGVLITPNVQRNTYCTAGPLAKLSNPATLAAELETFLITAGHCLKIPEIWSTAPHPGNVLSEIGPVVKALYDLFGDLGDIEVGSNWLEAGTTPALAQITNYQDNGLRGTRNVLGEAVGMQNESFCSQGATSGEQCGTITEVNALATFQTPNTDVLTHIHGLVKTNSCTNGGDSGGPFATLPTSNGVDILGTMVGGLVDGECAKLVCTTNCGAYYEPIRTSLEGLGLALLTTSNQTRHTSSHPMFLTANGNQLLFSGEGTKPILRGEQAGLSATVECEKILIHGFILPKSSLVHLSSLIFEAKCVQKINGGANEACTEPIETKRILAELGLISSTTKTVAILLAPSEGSTEFFKLKCGATETKFGGTIVGEIPELNALAEKQYNTEREELEMIFATNPAGTNKQKITTIFLLGTEMTGQELKVEGFLGGKTASEMKFTIKADGKVKLDV